MNGYFIDASYLVALRNQRDQWHEQALLWSQVTSGRFLTTDYVLLEVANSLAPARIRFAALDLIHALEADPRVTIVPQSRPLFDRGVGLYRARADKDWSLTDCISFVVMSDEGFSDALTSDHHFEQAGFRALLRMPLPSTSGP